VNEVVVGGYEDEIEAETAAGMLRAVEIPARVRYRATMGAPRPVAPIRVMAPFGEYELVVPAPLADEARLALRDAGQPTPRPQRYRLLGWVLLVAFFGPILANALSALLRLR
jgi:hypothetical protein